MNGEEIAQKQYARMAICMMLENGGHVLMAHFNLKCGDGWYVHAGS